MASIKSYNKRLGSLHDERSGFITLWRELSDYHLANHGKFLAEGKKTVSTSASTRNTKQLNNTSRLASRTLASGMMAGITSPARPWFRLSAGDSSLDEVAGVKEWLHAVQTLMYKVFSASNTYNALHMLYGELSVFGTGALGVFKDFDNVIWCKPYTAGSYFLGADGRNRVDTFYREYQLTVGAVIKEFGKDNCSVAVQQQWDRGNTESFVDIVHVVEPNDDRDMQSPLAKHKAIRSAYYEKAAGNRSTTDKYLRESGFNTFPILTPRWDVVGEDIYATDCPGMTAIGDTKALQLGEIRLYEAVDKVVSPPLQGPSDLRNKIEGGVLRADDIVFGADGNSKLSSIYNFSPDLNAIRELNNEAEQRIRRAFYEDLFLMLANSDRRQITAREVAEKHEEKLLMLGPVLERLHNELLDPLIDRVFAILQEEGALPPVPEELQGRDLNVEYVSVLAQAQRMVATGGLERLGGYVAELSAIWPEARHKFDAMQSVDEYAAALGTSPKVVRSDEEVQKRVDDENQQAAQAAAMEQGQALANTAKTMGDTSMEDENALTTMMRNAGLQ